MERVFAAVRFTLIIIDANKHHQVDESLHIELKNKLVYKVLALFPAIKFIGLDYLRLCFEKRIECKALVYKFDCTRSIITKEER